MADFNSGTTTVATDPTFDAKGDILVGTTNDASAVLSVGDENYLLSVADGTLAWTNTPTVNSLTTTGNIELGDPSDTTIARSGSGAISVEGYPVYIAGGIDVALADGGTGTSLSDPGADRLLFWDDGAGAVAFLTAGSGLTISGTTITAAGGGVPNPFFLA